MKYVYNFKIMLLAFALSWCMKTIAQSPERIEKEANKLFKNENYIEVTPMYLQLLSLEPRNHFYNFRYGACLLFNSEKKQEALKYLKFAVNNLDIDPEAYYYLARGYHLNFYFDKAIAAFNYYKSLVKDKTVLKRDVDRQIEMCKNGKKLVRNTREIAVKTKTSSSYENFFRIYNMKDIGGTIIVAEDFQSKIDIKKGHKPVVHIASDAKNLFYSSYGDQDFGHKDIYMRTINNKGEWANPVRLPNKVNTEFDEDYPYLDPNGKYLYFSSRGHNSMGGYDIFRVPYNQDGHVFGEVENLDFAISSPDDDLFYVVDKDNKHAYFASARQSEGGKIHVYRIAINTINENLVLCTGTFQSSVDPNFKQAVISIRDLKTGQIIEKLQANPSNGSFAFSLPKAGDYEFVVESEVSSPGRLIRFEVPNSESNIPIQLNFFEAQQGNEIRITMEPNFSYKLEVNEQEELLANVLSSKSQLVPNEAIWKIIERDEINKQTDESKSFEAILSDIQIKQYLPTELSVIAKKDVQQLKENYKENEQMKNVLLFTLQNAITEINEIDKQLTELVKKGINNNLTTIERQEILRLSELRQKKMPLALTTSEMTEIFDFESQQIKKEILLADGVEQIFKQIKTADNYNLLEDLTPEQKEFSRSKLNSIKPYDAAKSFNLEELAIHLAKIEQERKQLIELQQEIANNEFKISELEEQYEKAKKKPKEQIQKQIDELELNNKSLRLQSNIINRRLEQNSTTSDSLNTVLTVYNNLKNQTTYDLDINTSRTKLKMAIENLNQSDLLKEAATVLAQPESSESETTVFNDLDSIENIIIEEQLKYFEKRRRELRTGILQKESDLLNIDENISANSLTAKNIDLIQQKIRLIDDILDSLQLLNDLTEDHLPVEEKIEKYEELIVRSQNQLEGFEDELSTYSNVYIDNTKDSIINSADLTTDLSVGNSTEINIDPMDDTRNREVAERNNEINLNTNPSSIALDSTDYSDINVTEYQTAEKTKVNFNKQSVLNPQNYESLEIAEEIDDVRKQKKDLEFLSAEDENQKSKNSIVKNIDNFDARLETLERDLILSEAQDYDIIVEKLQQYATDATSKNPITKLELLILEQRKIDAQEGVTALAIARKKDITRIQNRTSELRDDFLNQYITTSFSISNQNEIERLYADYGIATDVFNEPDQLHFYLNLTQAELNQAKEQLTLLKKNFSNYKKSERTLIQSDIDQLEEYISKLAEIEKEIEILANQPISAAQEKLTLTSLNIDYHADISVDSDSEKIIVDSRFAELRNELIAHQVASESMNNVIRQKDSLATKMKALVLDLEIYNDVALSAGLIEELNATAQKYKQVLATFHEQLPAIEILNNRIAGNTLFQSNPTVIYHLALSAKTYDILSRQNQNMSTQMSRIKTGLTLLSEQQIQDKESSFALNPINMPGMIYKIQIGAFNRPVDRANFAAFEPITTDQPTENIIRYNAGVFYRKEKAFQSLPAVKNMGYPDAYVVAYCDGVRYTVAEADELLKKGKCSLNGDENETIVLNEISQNLNDRKGSNTAPAQPLEGSKGLLFTAQIGVFNSPISHARLQNLEPLNTQLTEKQQIRYSIGRFDDYEAAIQQRNAARYKGFSDAFVTAYFNGKMISIAEARKLLEDKGSEILHSYQKIDQIQEIPKYMETFENAPLVFRNTFNTFDWKWRLVSKESFHKAPDNLIRTIRNNGLWVYFDTVTNQIVSSKISEESAAKFQTIQGIDFDKAFDYQSFVLLDSLRTDKENLEQKLSERTFYSVTLTWEKELPFLAAQYVENNFTEAIWEWNTTNNSVVFSPLSYSEKERLIRIVNNFSGLKIKPSIVLY